MGIFETHAHYDDEAFDEDRDVLIKSLKNNGIDYVVNVGATMASTVSAVKLAAEYDHVYAAVGVHPSEVANLDEDFIQYMKAQAQTNSKVLAVGEIGLDYHWDEPARDVQRKWFIRQLDLAKEVGKPVIIHSRDACEETQNILLSPEYSQITGVIHCYSYSPEVAEKYVAAGWYIGVGGVVTFKNAKKLVDTVETIPLDRILLETDCPYMAPVPHRGERNSSLYLGYVVSKIAELKGVTEKEVIDVTSGNAHKLFGIVKNEEG